MKPKTLNVPTLYETYDLKRSLVTEHSGYSGQTLLMFRKKKEIRKYFGVSFFDHAM